MSASPAPVSPELRGVALQVAYDGSDFSGFAPQPHARTVHGALLKAAQAMDPSVLEVRGLSRTDAGVHARAQIIAFDTERAILPRGWVLGMNHHLPDSVRVCRARSVPAGFVPRFASLGKRYRYTLWVDVLADPLWARTSWHVHSAFDCERAQRELGSALGEHDFAAFRTAADQRPSTRRRIDAVSVQRDRQEPRLVHCVVEGPAFMHNMVRILIGTVVEVATGRKPEGTLANALRTLRRQDAGRTAPPQGLLLEEATVRWPEDAGEPWPPFA